jgi:hypothetical protein
MDPSMDTIELQTLHCDANDSFVSLAKKISSFQNIESSSSIISMNDFNPSTDWKLPGILPKEVYKMKW